MSGAIIFKRLKQLGVEAVGSLNRLGPVIHPECAGSILGFWHIEPFSCLTPIIPAIPEKTEGMRTAAQATWGVPAPGL